MQAHDDAPLCQEAEHAGLYDQAAPAGDHAPRERVALLHKPSFVGAECRLAVLGEDLGDGFPRPALDLVVAVDALEAYPLGNGAPNGRLAGSHETDEVQVDIRRIQVGVVLRGAGASPYFPAAGAA